MERNKCRFCGKELTETFVDLGLSPLANEYVDRNKVDSGEFFYPLRTKVCSECFLVQALEYEKPENIFNNYKYFSSYSKSWLEHCEKYVDMIVKRKDLNKDSRVIEIASNDGYLLQYFNKYKVPVLGIEPAGNVAKDAEKRGIKTIVDFFGVDLANKLINDEIMADLIIGNNVLAHVPDINDFVKGMKIILKEDGIITMEFPHLVQLIKNNQFDTIYHEHFSYLSLTTVQKIFNHNGLKIFDVEELPTHGGSIRIYSTHIGNKEECIRQSVSNMLKSEEEFGINNIEKYRSFEEKVKTIKRNVLKTIASIKDENKKIAAYGAAAKGNTLLNYCGIGKEFIDYVVDANPNKQGLSLPGSEIPIVSIKKIKETKPDYIIILPWNLRDEIVKLLEFTREWGCKFITFIPDTSVF